MKVQDLKVGEWCIYKNEIHIRLRDRDTKETEKKELVVLGTGEIIKVDNATNVSNFENPSPKEIWSKKNGRVAVSVNDLKIGMFVRPYYFWSELTDFGFVVTDIQKQGITLACIFEFDTSNTEKKIGDVLDVVLNDGDWLHIIPKPRPPKIKNDNQEQYVMPTGQLIRSYVPSRSDPVVVDSTVIVEAEVDKKKKKSRSKHVASKK